MAGLGFLVAPLGNFFLLASMKALGEVATHGLRLEVAIDIEIYFLAAFPSLWL